MAIRVAGPIIGMWRMLKLARRSDRLWKKDDIRGPVAKAVDTQLRMRAGTVSDAGEGPTCCESPGVPVRRMILSTTVSLQLDCRNGSSNTAATRELAGGYFGLFSDRSRGVRPTIITTSSCTARAASRGFFANHHHPTGPLSPTVRHVWQRYPT